MSKPKFTGVWIPSAVLGLPISITAKVCYGVVDGLDNDDGCFASNDYLKAVLGLETRQLQNILFELQDANLIRREEVEGRRIIRTVEKVALVNAIAGGQVTRSEGCNKLQGGVQKVARGGCKKLHTYSKDNNKEDTNTGANAPWVSPLPFPSESFSKVWQSWIDYRKELKKPLKDATVKAMWAEFLIWGEDAAIFSIQTSIKNGWQGIFEPKKTLGYIKAKPLTADDHNAF